jgi:hypothetical protein
MDSKSCATGSVSGPRCSCGRVAVFEREMVMHVYMYTLSQEGERLRLVSERQPRSSISYLCAIHGRPLMPRPR